MSADIYVNARGSLGSSCYIERYVVRYSGGGTAEAFIPTPHRIDGCATGRHTAITTSKIAGKLYRQYMQVVVNGNVVDSGWSPYTQ
ncbi:MAG: hypothetical protein HOV94_23620 [Saccharothrix sp.]|nr:hypothetical protein [Saccharothrix sp.]